MVDSQQQIPLFQNGEWNSKTRKKKVLCFTIRKNKGGTMKTNIHGGGIICLKLGIITIE